MSNEWLTTGQMIDRLKVGEVAECQTGEKVKIFEKSNLPYFQGIEKAICWILEDGEPFPFYMSEGNRNATWRILPNYVSFEEAMKAYFEGKTIAYHKGGNQWIFFERNGLGNKVKLEFQELVEDKWTIEDDTNA